MGVSVLLRFFISSNEEFLCISVLRVASGPRVKLAGCKSALNPAGLDDLSLAWPAVVQLLVFIYSGIQ